MQAMPPHSHSEDGGCRIYDADHIPPFAALNATGRGGRWCEIYGSRKGHESNARWKSGQSCFAQSGKVEKVVDPDRAKVTVSRNETLGTRDNTRGASCFTLEEADRISDGGGGGSRVVRPRSVAHAHFLQKP